MLMLPCARAASQPNKRVSENAAFCDAAVQRMTGRRMLMTASSLAREHAESDKLDQKDLTRQKG